MSDRLTPLRRAFLPPEEDASAWKHADTAIAALQLTLPLISTNTPSATALAALKAQLADLYTQLESSTYRVREDLRDPANSKHPLAVTWRRWHRG